MDIEDCVMAVTSNVVNALGEGNKFLRIFLYLKIAFDTSEPIRINLLFYLFFPVIPSNVVCFISVGVSSLI